jgi:hypothetical protein
VHIWVPDADDTKSPRHLFDESRIAAVMASGLLADGVMAEPEFDRYTRLAAAITGAPVARLSIVDTRGQHFKSAVGPLPDGNRGQAAKLRKLGCGAAQGFLFHRPLEAGQLAGVTRAEPRREVSRKMRPRPQPGR